MEIEFVKWGNSMAVRVPAELVHQGGLTLGSKAEITLEEGCLKVKPKNPKMSRKERLEWLLAGLENHGPDEEINWGPDQGNEIIEW